MKSRQSSVHSWQCYLINYKLILNKIILLPDTLYLIPDSLLMIPDSLLNNFKKFIRDENLISPSDQILLAVSGGMDSVVMVHLFKQAEFNFAIAHCNFQLRGNDSNADEAFVKQLAENYGVSFYSQVFDTTGHQKKNKLSLEAAARELRYAWFEEIRSLFNYTSIATAHHLNDSIETVFLNLIKGTGIKGLSGIPKINGKIIRPMLFAAREMIEDYAKANQIEFRTDTTNFENDFVRNKIRNTIIPVLKTVNPSLEETFKKNILHIEEAHIIYQEQVRMKLNKLIKVDGNNQMVSIPSILQLKSCKTYMHEFLFHYGFNEDQIQQIITSLKNPGKVFYSATHRVIIDRKNMILCPIENEHNSILLIQQENKTVRFGAHKLDLQISKYHKEIKFNTTGSVAYFDADKIEYPLTLRKWEKGDYFYPLGLTKKNSDKPGKKKISDLFNDLKYNLLQKENTWVMLSGEKIIWVVGIRQDERISLRSTTSNMLKIKMLP